MIGRNIEVERKIGLELALMGARYSSITDLLDALNIILRKNRLMSVSGDFESVRSICFKVRKTLECIHPDLLLGSSVYDYKDYLLELISNIESEVGLKRINWSEVVSVGRLYLYRLYRAEIRSELPPSPPEKLYEYFKVVESGKNVFLSANRDIILIGIVRDWEAVDLSGVRGRSVLIFSTTYPSIQQIEDYVLKQGRHLVIEMLNSKGNNEVNESHNYIKNSIADVRDAIGILKNNNKLIGHDEVDSESNGMISDLTSMQIKLYEAFLKLAPHRERNAYSSDILNKALHDVKKSYRVACKIYTDCYFREVYFYQACDGLQFLDKLNRVALNLASYIAHHNSVDEQILYVLQKSISTISKNSWLYKLGQSQVSFAELNLSTMLSELVSARLTSDNNYSVQAEDPAGSGRADISISYKKRKVAIVETKLAKTQSEVSRCISSGLKQLIDRYSLNIDQANPVDDLYLVVFTHNQDIRESINIAIQTLKSSKHSKYSVVQDTIKNWLASFTLVEVEDYRKSFYDKSIRLTVIMPNLELTATR